MKIIRTTFLIILIGFLLPISFGFVSTDIIFAQEDDEPDNSSRTITDKIVYNRLESKAKLKSIIGWSERIDFVLSDLSMESYLTLFTSQYDVNVLNLSNPKTKPKLSLSLKAMHPADIFDTIINSWNCDWYFSQGILKIIDNFPVKVFNLNYISASDVQESLTSIVGLQSMSINESNNSIMVRGAVESLEQVKYLLRGLDVPPKQVLISVKIVEISKTLSDTLGVGFNTDTSGTETGIQTKGYADTAENSTLSGLFFKGVGGNFLMNFNSSLTNANSDVLANPEVLVANHQKASIVTGERLGYSTVTQTQTASIQSVKFLESGIKLEITPHITSDSEILMEILPEISEGRIENNLPRESTIRTETKVMVKNGQTLVIGGLMQNKNTKSVSGIPILSDIPVLDLIFQKTSDNDQKREVVVLITPTLIDIENDDDTLLPVKVQDLLKKVSEQDTNE